MRTIHPDYLRSIVFGLQDSLVSTTGVVAGISTGVSDPKIILLAGLVAVAVEALSMGAGQYLSERSVHQLEKNHTDNLIVGASLMFLSYAVAGVVPIAPVLFLPYPGSILLSVTFALFALFLVGFLTGRFLNVSALRNGVTMLFVGGLATVLGVIVGIILKV